MSNFTTFFLSNFTLTFFIIGIFFSITSILKNLKSINKPIFVEKLFSWFLLFPLGIGMIYNFIMHLFFQEMSATFIGWENSPFQLEVGFASLGYGIIAIIAFKSSLSFRSAVIISNSMFLWGAAGGHIYQMTIKHNFASGNAGIIFWTDLILPIIGYFLLYLQYKYRRQS